MAAPRVVFAGRTIPAYAKTVGRAVHVKIYPQPRNLAESREVLRVLQQYGEIVSYKLLKYDYFTAVNTALAIYQNTSSAEKIVNASPLRFEFGKVESSSSVPQFIPPTTPSAKEEKEEDSNPAQGTSDNGQEEFDEVNTARKRPNEASGQGTAFTGLGGTARWGRIRSSLSTQQAATSPSPEEPPPKTFTPNPTPRRASAADLPNPPFSAQSQDLTSTYFPPREFHLTIERSFLNHHAYIQRQHYYAGFELDVRSLMGDDLRTRVPVPGMADCQLEKPEVPLRFRMKRMKREEEEEEEELGTGLRKLWEEGERERRMEPRKEGKEAKFREWKY